MRPETPETDAALYPINGVDIVWPDHARKLERERDEWKSIAKTRAETITQYQLRAHKAEEELDNIREQYRIAVDMAALAQNRQR